MKAHQLLQAVSKDLQTEIISYLHTQHAGAYNMVLSSLAQHRKLRPVFLQRKPTDEQYAWVIKLLQGRSMNSLSEQVMQIWLLKNQQDMLATFLDAVGIEHKKGEVENLPDDITDDQAAAGVAALVAKFPAENAAVYLHMFQLQREGGWPSIAKAMDAEPKLKLNVPA